MGTPIDMTAMIKLSEEPRAKAINKYLLLLLGAFDHGKDWLTINELQELYPDHPFNRTEIHRFTKKLGELGFIETRYIDDKNDIYDQLGRNRRLQVRLSRDLLKNVFNRNVQHV